MPTPKAIHICNSHQPMLQPKIVKDYVFANAHKQTNKNNEVITRVRQKWGFSDPQTHLGLSKIWFSASTFWLKSPLRQVRNLLNFIQFGQFKY